MPDKEKHYLDSSLIESLIEDFFNEKYPSVSYEIKKRKGISQNIEVIENGIKAILSIYSGHERYSHSININNSTNHICEECWLYLIDKATIAISEAKVMMKHNVLDEDFVALLSLYKEEPNIIVEDEDVSNSPNIKRKYKLTNEYGSQLYFIHYTNNTFHCQGAPNKFYYLVASDIIQCFSIIGEEEIKELLSIKTNNEVDKFSSNISELFPKKDNLDNFLQSWIYISITLINNPLNNQNDYSYTCFTILRALEAILRKRIELDIGVFDKFDMFCLTKNKVDYVFHKSFKVYDSNSPLKKSLERAYTLIGNERNSLFHVNTGNIKFSRQINIEQAENIINDSIVAIREILNNW